MASIQLINRVFSLLGRKPQGSVEQDPWGSLISTTIDSKTRIIVDNYNWSFATKYAELARSTTSSNPRYQYEFTLVNDVARVLSAYLPFTENGITKADRPLELWQYESSNRNIFTNGITRLMIKYVSYNIDAALQVQAFQDGVAYLSASEAALTLLENPQLEKEFAERAVTYINMARANDIQAGAQRKWRVNRRLY